jgi:hypothetical protein
MFFFIIGNLSKIFIPKGICDDFKKYDGFEGLPDGPFVPGGFSLSTSVGSSSSWSLPIPKLAREKKMGDISHGRVIGGTYHLSQKTC